MPSTPTIRKLQSRKIYPKCQFYTVTFLVFFHQELQFSTISLSPNNAPQGKSQKFIMFCFNSLVFFIVRFSGVTPKGPETGEDQIFDTVSVSRHSPRDQKLGKSKLNRSCGTRRANSYFVVVLLHCGFAWLLAALPAVGLKTQKVHSMKNVACMCTFAKSLQHG